MVIKNNIFLNYCNLLEKIAKAGYNSNVLKRYSRKNERKDGGIKMATREKNIWVLLVFLLAGLVIGGLLGKLASEISWLWWLSYGQSFGLSNPIVLDLNVLKLTFGVVFDINIASIIGMILAVFIYRKV